MWCSFPEDDFIFIRLEGSESFGIVASLDPMIIHGVEDFLQVDGDVSFFSIGGYTGNNVSNGVDGVLHQRLHVLPEGRMEVCIYAGDFLFGCKHNRVLSVN